MHGIDLSNNNSRTDWDGVDFHLDKITEGLGFVDHTAASWIAQGGARPWSMYHFAHPDQHEPEDEADFFLSNAQKGALRPALDCETRPGANPLAIMGAPKLGDWCNRYCRRVANAWKQEPYFYSFRDMTTHLLPYLDPAWPLWLASAAGAPDIYKHFGGRAVAIDQWGIVDGIDQNESYLDLTPGVEPVANPAYVMVTPTFYHDEHGQPDPKRPHRWRDAVFLSDGIVATHVSDPAQEQLYKNFGIGGPNEIHGQWMDNIAVLATPEFKP